jgi:hypothetical protein
VIVINLDQTTGEFVEGNADGARKVTGLKLKSGTDVNHRHIARFNSREQFFNPDGLNTVDLAEESLGELTHLGQPRLGERSQRLIANSNRFISESVDNVETPSAGSYEATRAQNAEVPRGVRDRHPRRGGDGFDGSRSLSQEINNLHSLWTGESCTDSSQLLEDSVFEFARFHRAPIQLIT